jgi:urease accessory protein
VGLSNEAPQPGVSAFTWSSQSKASAPAAERADAGEQPSAQPASDRAHFGQADGWRASLELSFDRRADKTVLARSRHFGPLRVQRPFYPERNGTCHVYVLHPPGGVASGDQLRVELALEADACALLTTPGATKLYRSRGAEAHIVQRMSLAEGACLEWLPQETIVFDGAEASLETQIDLAPGAVYAGWEIVCLGRPACGESFERGRLRSALRLRRGGRLRYAERGDYLGGGPVLSQPWGLGGAPVFGLFVLADERADESWVERVREQVQCQAGNFAVTLMSGLLLGRYLGSSTLDARASFESMFGVLRPLYTSGTAITPRIWRT